LCLISASAVATLRSLWPFAAASLVVAVAVLWLCGAWAGHRSPYRYAKQLSDIWAGWAADVEQAEAQFRRDRERLARRVKALVPPTGASGIHARLLDALADTDRSAVDASSDLATRARDAINTLALMSEVADAMPDRAMSAEASKYAGELKSVIAEWRSSYGGRSRDVERLNQSAVDGLAGLRPPSPAADAHAGLVDAFRAHATAVSDLYAALEAQDASRAITAADAVNRARERVREAESGLKTRVRL
jgi:hypothetical protein